MQARRVHARYMLGMKVKDIAAMEGITPSQAGKSIHAARRLSLIHIFYARDTSRKIRSVCKSKGMSGKHLTGTVIYGYLWDEKREHWLCLLYTSRCV